MRTTTHHARERMASRGISAADIELTLEHGEVLHRAGAVFYVLRGRDIPAGLADEPMVRRAEGTTVVVEHGRIATVYRNPDVRHVRRKPKRSRVPRHERRTWWA